MFNVATEENDAVYRGRVGLESFLEWTKGREWALLAIGMVFQMVVLVTMTLSHFATLIAGDTILLRVTPVDPRNLFRGDYVILGYAFSSVPQAIFKGHEHLQSPGQVVYVSLEPAPDGKHWRASSFSLQPPSDGKFLRGRIKNHNRIEFGIESYFVQEGEGMAYERAVRTGNLSAEIALARSGKAILKRLVIE